jgi:hypothetical protein
MRKKKAKLKDRVVRAPRKRFCFKILSCSLEAELNGVRRTITECYEQNPRYLDLGDELIITWTAEAKWFE